MAADATAAGLVLDSWAVLAWLQDEPAAGRVQRYLDQAAEGTLALHLSAVNAGEVYYQLVRAGRAREAVVFWHSAARRQMPLRLAAVTLPRVRRAAAIKARYPWRTPMRLPSRSRPSAAGRSPRATRRSTAPRPTG